MAYQKATAKNVIIEAAISLFNTKGFQGTTIRDIAAKANVNTANISYYFQGKQGLLEECLILFFEPYLECLEEGLKKLDKDQLELSLMKFIKGILYFQSNHFLLTRLVWREVTIDSQVTREITSSYLMKERYYFKTMIQTVLKDSRTTIPLSMIVVQLKGMLMMPYLNSQYVREVWGLNPEEPYFINKYYLAIKRWIESFIDSPIYTAASNG